MSIRDLVREDLRELVPYEPHPFSNVVKLDANENSHTFPKDVIKEIFASLQGDLFTRYPDPGGEELKEKIAESTGTTRSNIILGNGSDELIQLILQTFGGPGKRVVIPVPTFSMYKIHGQITGTEPVEVARNEDFGLHIGRLLPEMKHPDTRITFIATPNNPTGNSVSPDLIEEITAQVGSLVVVDEAYVNFGGETCLPLLERFPNLIILRTFSKIGLAGLRVGYLIANAEVTRELQKVRQPYNLNAFSQRAVLIAMNYWELFRRQIDEIVSERQRVIGELETITGVTVYPTDANFILFKVPGSAPEQHSKLLERGVLVRKNPGYGLEQCLRVTVGTREENDLFLEKLKEILV